MVDLAEKYGALPEEAADEALIETLPKEVGVLFCVVGVGGILLPGPVGAPFLILGGVILFPKTFRKLDRGLRRRFPKLHREGMHQAARFVRDLERRYPTPR